MCVCVCARSHGSDTLDMAVNKMVLMLNVYGCINTYGNKHMTTHDTQNNEPPFGEAVPLPIEEPFHFGQLQKI